MTESATKPFRHASSAGPTLVVFDSVAGVATWGPEAGGRISVAA
jgi:hypothetical protein